jgi:transcriptional regulator with XRE-family HTH domain
LPADDPSDDAPEAAAPEPSDDPVSEDPPLIADASPTADPPLTADPPVEDAALPEPAADIPADPMPTSNAIAAAPVIATTAEVPAAPASAATTVPPPMIALALSPPPTSAAAASAPAAPSGMRSSRPALVAAVQSMQPVAREKPETIIRFFHAPIVNRTGAADLIEVATSTALPSAGLAMAPRLPNAVAVAVEFGRAGHGWAGALVFNVWLRREMRERRLSQRQLAYLSGVNHSTISRILSDGRAPSLETATKLAHALRMDWSDEKIAAYFDILAERAIPPAQRVEAALRGDPDLSDEDIKALMNSYLVRRGRQRIGRQAP